ncbi:hypothetical protein [Streptomyces sp. NPDC001135]
MREAALALAEVGLPSELADAAAAVMERWDGLKDTSPALRSGTRELHAAPPGGPV